MSYHQLSLDRLMFHEDRAHLHRRAKRRRLRGHEDEIPLSRILACVLYMLAPTAKCQILTLNPAHGLPDVTLVELRGVRVEIPNHQSWTSPAHDQLLRDVRQELISHRNCLWVRGSLGKSVDRGHQEEVRPNGMAAEKNSASAVFHVWPRHLELPRRKIRER